MFYNIIIAIICLSSFFFFNCENNIEEYNRVTYGLPPHAPAYYNPRAWHPESPWIIVTHSDSIDTNNDGKKDDYYFGPWLLHEETLEKRPFTDIYGFGSVKWSKDGRKLVMERWGHIYTIAVISLDPLIIDMTSLTQLTFEGRNYHPVWSPDGEWIAYDSDLSNPNAPYTIWKMRKDGTMKKDISIHGLSGWRQPDWSPDGKRILYHSSDEIFTMDVNGKDIKQLTLDDNPKIYAKYSPDGTKIAYNSFTPYGLFLWIMNSDGTDAIRIDNSSGFRWSPDVRILFLRTSYNTSFDGIGDLWLINADGTGLQRFTYTKN